VQSCPMLALHSLAPTHSKLMSIMMLQSTLSLSEVAVIQVSSKGRRVLESRAVTRAGCLMKVSQRLPSAQHALMRTVMLRSRIAVIRALETLATVSGVE
jgi:hypothetical protein